MVSISRNNMKVGAIPTFSLPTGVTCRECAGCIHKCYARKMEQRRANIRNAWRNNLTEWQSKPEAVKYAILSSAITSGYFRYFVGGDIPDKDFFKMMVEIADIAKSCQFLAFTKKYEIVNDFIANGGKIPKNLHIVFSGWGESLRPINPHNLPESDVIFKGDTEPLNAKICGGNCTDCICKGVACWALQSGETIYFYEH